MGNLATRIPQANIPFDEEDEDRTSFEDLASLDENQIIKLRPCFGSDARYFCKRDCQWAKQCKRLKAEWLR